MDNDRTLIRQRNILLRYLKFISKVKKLLIRDDVIYYFDAESSKFLKLMKLMKKLVYNGRRNQLLRNYELEISKVKSFL